MIFWWLSLLFPLYTHKFSSLQNNNNHFFFPTSLWIFIYCFSIFFSFVYLLSRSHSQSINSLLVVVVVFWRLCMYVSSWWHQHIHIWSIFFIILLLSYLRFIVIVFLFFFFFFFLMMSHIFSCALKHNMGKETRTTKNNN